MAPRLWEIPGCRAIVTHWLPAWGQTLPTETPSSIQLPSLLLAAENSEASRALAVVTSLLKIQEILWHPQFQCFTRTTCRIQDSTLLGLSFSYKMCDSRPAKGEHVQGLWWGLPDRKLSCSQNPSLPSTWKQDPTSGEYFLLESQHVGFIAWMALRLSQSPSASIPRGWVASETGGNGAGHTL